MPPLQKQINITIMSTISYIKTSGKLKNDQMSNFLLTDQIHIRQVCIRFFTRSTRKFPVFFYDLPEGVCIASATHRHLGNIFLNIIWLAWCLDPWDNKGLQDVIYFQTEHHSYEAQYRMNLRLDWQGWPPSPQYT